MYRGEPALIESLNREAVASQSPGLPGFGGYPGNRSTQVSNLEEVASVFLLPAVYLCSVTFGATPLGLDHLSVFPRVAAKARQPWALGRNRFAVKELARMLDVNK